MSGEADSFSLGDSPGMTMSRDNVFMPGESPTGGEMVGTSVFLEAHPGDHGGDSERNPELISGSGSPYYHVAAEDPRLPSSSGHQPEFEYTTSVSNSRAEIGPPPEEQYNFQFDDEAPSVEEGVPGTRTHDDYFDDHFSPPDCGSIRVNDATGDLFWRPGGWGGTAQPPPPYSTEGPGPAPRKRSRTPGEPGPLRAHVVAEGKHCQPGQGVGAKEPQGARGGARKGRTITSSSLLPCPAVTTSGRWRDGGG